jgi:hypothetical protein
MGLRFQRRPATRPCGERHSSWSLGTGRVPMAWRGHARTRTSYRDDSGIIQPPNPDVFRAHPY